MQPIYWDEFGEETRTHWSDRNGKNVAHGLNVNSNEIHQHNVNIRTAKWQSDGDYSSQLSSEIRIFDANETSQNVNEINSKTFI